MASEVIESRLTAEIYLPLADERISRRGLFRVFGTVALAAAASKLREGVRLDEHPIELRTVSVHRSAEDIQLFFESTSEEGKVETITIADNKLLYEPSGEYFFPDEPIPYTHRTNDPKSVMEGFRLGARMYDVDANKVEGVDTVFAEHGIIVNAGKGPFRLPHIVVDVNEKELKIGMPHYTFEDMVRLISSLSSDERQLALSVELKRGEYDYDTLMGMFGILRENRLPAIMYSTHPGLIMGIGKEIAHSHGIAL